MKMRRGRGRSFLLLSAPCLSSHQGLNLSAEIMGRGRHSSTDRHVQIVISCHHTRRSAVNRLPLTAESRSHRYVTAGRRSHGGAHTANLTSCSPPVRTARPVGGFGFCHIANFRNQLHLQQESQSSPEITSRRTVPELFMNQQKFSVASVERK